MAAASTPTTGVASDAMPATPAGKRERMNIHRNHPSAAPPIDMNAIAATNDAVHRTGPPIASISTTSGIVPQSICHVVSESSSTS